MRTEFKNIFITGESFFSPLFRFAWGVDSASSRLSTKSVANFSAELENMTVEFRSRPRLSPNTRPGNILLS